MEDNFLKKPLVSHQEAIVLGHIPGMQDQERVLGLFTPEQKQDIERKRQILQALIGSVSGNYTIPVVVGVPTKKHDSGWFHVKLEDGREFIQINAVDLVEKSMDFCRFVAAHEAGHDRITKWDFINTDPDLKKLYHETPGFAYLLNCTEDPRDNNFVAEVYAPFREHMKLGYELREDVDKELLKKAKERMGFIPRHMLAGTEYIDQWFRQSQGLPFMLNEDLPSDVQEVVLKTLPYANDSWWRFPSKEEVERDPSVVEKYARTYMDINVKHVWPEFSKLMEADKKDQRLQEVMKDVAKNNSDSEHIELPPWLEKVLSDKQKEELLDLLRELMKMMEVLKNQEAASDDKPKDDTASDEFQLSEQGDHQEQKQEKDDEESEESEQGVPPLDLDKLSESLKDKINEGIEQEMAPEEREQFEQQAEESLKDFDDKALKELQDVAKSHTEEKIRDEDNIEDDDEESEQEPEELPPQKDLREGSKKIPTGNPDSELEQIKVLPDTYYQKVRQENIKVVNQLENDLRLIFKVRRESHMKRNLTSGSRINISKRIQEKARGVSVVDSRAYEQRTLPVEKDYAITLLVDLSGSMGDKIEETFAGVVSVTDALARLGIKTEIIGFNNKLHQFKSFQESMSRDIQNKMGHMIDEVHSRDAAYNNDGYAVLAAAHRLKQQREKEKILVVFSDGEPAPSGKYDRFEYDLNHVVDSIMEAKDIEVVGVGLGPDTEHVSSFYPKSVADISMENFSKELASIIREVVEGN